MKLAIIVCTLFLITLSSADDTANLSKLLEKLLSNTKRLHFINNVSYQLPKNSWINGRVNLKTSTNDAELTTAKVLSYSASSQTARIRLTIPSLKHRGVYANELTLRDSSTVVKDNAAVTVVLKDVVLDITANINEKKIWNMSVVGTIGSADGKIKGLMNDKATSEKVEKYLKNLPNLVKLHPAVFTSVVSPVMEKLVNMLF